MPDVLIMTTFQFGNPVIFVVQVEADDTTLSGHGNYRIYPQRLESALSLAPCFVSYFLERRQHVLQHASCTQVYLRVYQHPR